jgi:acyl-CoA reductase-like NAD-dependent aldehyde dehydrogenase
MRKIMLSKTPNELREIIKSIILNSLPKTPYWDGKYQTHNSSRDVISIYDPFTLEKLCEIEEANSSDIECCVNSARKVFEEGTWSRIHPRQRSKVLHRLADLIEQKKEEIALLEAVDTGKRFAGTLAWDIPNAIEVYRYYAGLSESVFGEYYPPVGNFRFHSLLEPVGVVAAIMPWNFPFACLAWKIAPALATGCSVIIKSAERAPLTTHYIGNLLAQAGFPDGVVNILPGKGETTGRTLVNNPNVNKITFTGSTDTAKDILVNSVNHLPRLSLELGGKSPNVIMNDCNLEKALDGTFSAIFDVAGQNCLAGSRTFVQSGIYDEFVSKLAEKTEARILGDNLENGIGQGPQIDIPHVEQIEGFVERAKSEGGEIITGGKKGKTDNFYLPTLVSCKNDKMEIVNREVFGPVGSILKFDSFEEVISRANSTQYGLASAIWTNNQMIADEFSTKIHSGTVWINCYGMIDTVAPWGGVKQSGYGKELGHQALEDFLTTKVVFTDISV